MNSIKKAINVLFSDFNLSIVFLASIFALPLNLFLNNLFFTLFFIAFYLRIFLTESGLFFKSFKQNYLQIVIFSSPALIILIGIIYTDNISKAFNDFGRMIPILFTVPLVYYRPHFFKKLLVKIFQVLALGCLLSVIISWSLSFIEIFNNNQPIIKLFSQKYAYHNLSEKTGIHTPYLGLFFSISIFYLTNTIISKPFKKQNLVTIVWAIILFIFLLNLLSRTAIFTLIIGLIILFISREKYLLSLSLIISIFLIGTWVYIQDNNFLRDRVFKSVNVFEEKTIFTKKDDRFTRFQVSIEVFKQFPIIGPGTANEDKYRKEIYLRNRDSKAYNENYNAHNQFLEYLSTYGILGGLLFLLIVYSIFRKAINKKDSVIYFMCLSFLLASFTESILERSWGVSFYLLLIIYVNTTTNKEIK